jgi:hypothetical protein
MRGTVRIISFIAAVFSVNSFGVKSNLRRLMSTTTSSQGIQAKTLFGTKDDSEEKVQVGSKEYLEGFLSSPIQDSTVPGERGNGLEQAVKLSGGAAVVLAILFFGFMSSNGLL